MPRHPFLSKIEKELNPPQKEAVLHTEGPLLVLSGAGSGKTRVIAYRIAYLISVQGLAPWNVLALTFTNKSAAEMRERVESLLGISVKGLWIGTFHSICSRMLRQEGKAAGIDPHFVIYDHGDQLSTVKQAMAGIEFDGDKPKPAAMLNQLSKAKNRFEWPADYEKNAKSALERKTAVVYRRYTEILKQNNALDFDDLLMQCVRLLLNYPDVCGLFRKRFKQILVDEYQDTNHPQYLMLRELAKDHHKICAVGDDDQSIYRWRGASLQNILDFERDYPTMKTVRLEQNYRSTKTIVAAAQAVVQHNTKRHEKNLWSDLEEGEKVGIVSLEDGYEEARWIIREIQRLRIERGLTYNQFAVFYRVNAQSRILEEECVRQGLPYHLVGATAFYERKEIKDVKAYMQLLVNPADSMAFQRIVNEPKRKLGEMSVAKMINFAQRTQMPILEAAIESINRIHETDMKMATCQAFHHFSQGFARWKKMSPELSLAKLTETVVKESGYWSMLEDDKDPQSQARLENVQELITAVAQFEIDLENQTGAVIDALTKLEVFLENISLISDVDKLNQAEDAIHFMTLHCAKGLEFPYVFIAGMEEGLLPHKNSMFETAELEEERRLCYVGITRGMKKVYLTYADCRRLYNQSEYTTPSSFLKEIPSQYVEEYKPEYNSMQNNRVAVNLPNFGVSFTKDDNFEPGDMVNHRSFGFGVIIEINGEGDKAIITVDFQSVGKKSLVKQYARLEKV